MHAAAISVALTLVSAAPRYTTIFTAPTAAAELRLIRDLSKAGIKFVDDAQSRKIRSVTDAGTLISGTVPEVITTLDADIIVAAIVRTTRLESAYLGKDAAKQETVIEAKVIAVDTGEVLGAFSVREGAIDFRAEKAADTSAENAAAKLAVEILEKVPKELAPATIELSIENIPNVTQQSAIEAGLRALPGVKQVNVLQAGRGMTKIELALEHGNAKDLATAIDGTPELGLTVFGYTQRAVHAESALPHARRYSLGTAQLEGPKGAWEGKAVSKILETALVDSGAVTLEKGPRERTLTLAGSSRWVKDKLHIEARLLAASTKKVIASSEKDCAPQDLGDCAGEVGRALASGLELPAAAPAKKPLAIAELKIEDLFAVHILRYAEQGFGRVHITNSGKTALTNAKLSVDVPGLTRGKTERAIPDLRPGGSGDVVLLVALDKDALLREDESRPVVVRVEVSANDGDLTVQTSRSIAAVLRGRHTFSWKMPESISAFVTPEDAEIVRWARAAYNAIPAAERDRPLAVPVALFASMSALKYSPDPTHPSRASDLDYVQYPVETASIGGGDCDDLAVLYAALAEAVGVPTLILGTPSHVFVAVDSGVPTRNRALVIGDNMRVMDVAGHMYIPIETTMLGASFEEAWREGAKQMFDTKNIEVVRHGWKEYPAAGLAHATLSPPSPDALAPEIARALAALENARRADLEKSTPPDLNNKPGVVFASLGKIDEAKKAIEAAIAKDPKSGAALNNLGNVEMIAGRAKEAIARYDAALVKLPSSPQVHANASIAAWITGDDRRFADHIASCLASGGEALVRELAERGLGINGGGRGADRAGRDVRAFAEALDRALEKSGKKPVGGKTRASQAGAELPVERWLYWL